MTWIAMGIRQLCSEISKISEINEIVTYPLDSAVFILAIPTRYSAR